jgi:hypothetical protein
MTVKYLAAHQNSPRALRYLPDTWAGASIDVVLDERGIAITSTGPFLTGQTLDATLDDISRNTLFNGRMNLAVNVRGYGLLDELVGLLTWEKIHAVVYNVPGPELPTYLATRLVVLGRLSEYEDQTVRAKGILVDSLSGSPAARKQLLVRAKRTHLGAIFLMGEALQERPELDKETLNALNVDYLITRRES